MYEIFHIYVGQTYQMHLEGQYTGRIFIINDVQVVIGKNKRVRIETRNVGR